MYLGPGSNRHSRKNRILNPARLPVPPPRHSFRLSGLQRYKQNSNQTILYELYINLILAKFKESQTGKLQYSLNPSTMKRILYKWDKFKLGRRLHYLQKRLRRAEENGYQDKINNYNRLIRDVQEKLKHIKE